MQSVAGVIYPVDVQSLVIQGIVAIHIGIGVMDNSMDGWSLVQSVEGSWDTSSVISPPLHSRPKSAPLQHCTSTSRSSPGVSLPSVCIASGGHEHYGVFGTVFSSATSRYPEGFRFKPGG